MENFFQALAALLPTGFAWPRDAGSTLMRVMRGIAGAFSEHHDFTTEAVRQWQPATTVNRLAEWEAATGLPDACFAPPLALLGPGSYLVGREQIAAFSRAGPALYVDAAGVLQTAAADVPRRQYDPTNLGAAPTYLFEAAATNSMPWFKGFVASWTNNGTAGWTDNFGIAPDGSLSTTQILPGGTRYRTVTMPANSRVCYSYFAKKTAGANLLMFMDGAGVIGTTGFRLSLQTLAITGLTASAVNYGVQDYGAFVRVFCTFLTSAVGGVGGFHMYPVAGSAPYEAWGAQVEIGANEPGSPIPTAGAAVTRAADIAYLFPTEAATRDLRRQLLLSRLRGPVLAYDNSSTASPDAIVAICAGLGYVATAAYNTPFRCGDNRVGDRLGALNGKLYVTVTLQSKAFRVGVSRVGQRLLEGQLNGGELACYLQRVIPARYQLNMIFI